MGIISCKRVIGWFFQVTDLEFLTKKEYLRSWIIFLKRTKMNCEVELDEFMSGFLKEIAPVNFIQHT